MADGEVAGAQNATGDVLRPAFQIIKTLPGVSVVSGAFIMILKDKQWGEDGYFCEFTFIRIRMCCTVGTRSGTSKRDDKRAPFQCI